MDKETRRDRYNPRTESLLKQFQKWGEGGCQAQTRDWDCRYEYMFTLADEHKDDNAPDGEPETRPVSLPR